MIIVVGLVFLLVICLFVILDHRWYVGKPHESAGKAPSEGPRTSKALVLFSKSGPYTVVHDWPRPTIAANELLIKVHTIGLNPIDWKCVTYGFGVHSIPWISGREASGTVEEIGEDVRNFSRGDKVFVISTNYRDNRTSAFQEFVVVASFNVGRLPDWMSFEQGATIGVGAVAAAEALFYGLRVRVPFSGDRAEQLPTAEKSSVDDETPWILVWGGSCVTGMMATQLARQNGYRVLAVAGLQNASYLASLGANRVVDRHQPEVAIAEAQQLQIRLGVDCVGQQTATWALQALQPSGRLAYLVKGPDQGVVAASNVEVTGVLIKRFHEDAGYGQSLMDYISSALATHAIRPIRHQQISGGFEVLQKGLDSLKSESISGRKLVVTIGESWE